MHNETVKNYNWNTVKVRNVWCSVLNKTALAKADNFKYSTSHFFYCLIINDCLNVVCFFLAWKQGLAQQFAFLLNLSFMCLDLVLEC